MSTGAFRTANATVSAHGAAPVTTSDSAIIPITRSLFIGVGGDVVVQMADGQDTVTFKNCNSGTILPVQVVKVYTATSATNIVALY